MRHRLIGIHVSFLKTPGTHENTWTTDLDDAASFRSRSLKPLNFNVINNALTDPK